ncbi:MAG: threonine synthase [Candidatus Neomarinimicrobiota bacterium]
MMELEQRLQGYRCLECGKLQPPEPFPYTCGSCGANLDAVYNYDVIGRHWDRPRLAGTRDRSLWRYAPLLPVIEPLAGCSIQVGGTPLVAVPRLADEIGITNLWIKDDTRNPSGSLKDRASEVGLCHAAEAGLETLVTASTGNAAASLAALAAYHGRQAVILAPADAPPAKLTQILQYGATLCPVDGSYDDAFDLATVVAGHFGWYLRSTGINPVMSEGKKTVALEIAEQLDWQVPDFIFVPVGDGCIIGGVFKGFFDLLQLGWIDRLPRIVAVQAEGSAAIVRALEANSEIVAVAANTVADSIAVDLPRDGLKALRAVRESDGFGIVVSDEAILQAQKKLAETTGIFVEPAAAAAFAGLLRAREGDLIKSGESAVVLATGSGLKDIAAAQRILSIPAAIRPDIESFVQFIETTSR